MGSKNVRYSGDQRNVYGRYWDNRWYRIGTWGCSWYRSFTDKYSSGWWLSLPLWKMMEFVSWDDEIPNRWKVTKIMFQTTNQFWISIKRKHSPEDLGYFGIVTPTRTTISSVTSRRGGCIPIPWAEQMTSSFLQLHPAVHSLNHYIYRYTVIYLP